MLFHDNFIKMINYKNILNLFKLIFSIVNGRNNIELAIDNIEFYFLIEVRVLNPTKR